MTDRSIRHDQPDQFDREIQKFLAWHADDVGSAPTATEIAARIASGKRTGVVAPRLAPQFVWIVLLGLLLAALVGAALVGASLLRPNPRPFGVEPDNGWIAVSANPSGVDGGEVGDIYLISDNAAARRIIGSDFDGVAQACPSFSPDGHTLAYGEATASEQPVTTFRGEWPVPNRAVVIVDINDAGDASSPIMRVPIPPDPGEIPCPKWSPDGKYVAFRHGSALWVADPASGESTTFRLTEAPWGQQGFAWSQDGTRIAVAEPGQIRIVPNNAAETTVIPVEGATPGQLSWAGGNDRIVYTSTDELGDGLGIFVVGVDGDSNTRLTPTSVDLQLSFSYSAVSPDGTRVAYLQRTYRCDTDGCSQDPEHLSITDIDDLSVVELPIPANFAVGALQWSPDGERLLLSSLDGLISVGIEPDSEAIVHVGNELNREWAESDVTWQPVYP